MTHFQHQTLQQTSFPCRLIVKTYRVKNSLDEPNWVTTLEWNEIHVAVYEDSEPVVTSQPWHAIKGNMTSGSYPALCFLAEFSGICRFSAVRALPGKTGSLKSKIKCAFGLKCFKKNASRTWPFVEVANIYLTLYICIPQVPEIPINWFQNIIFSELNKFPK